MKIAIQLIRVIVGVLFIFSGLIKANDPLGLAYKMEEYFAVWGWHWASNYSLYLSIGMNVLEIVAGIALLLGWASHLITRLLLVLIVFFTFLTGYAVVTGSPKTCGCFGDCLPLKAWQSFAKDILLLALCWLLYKYRHYVKAFLPLRANLFLVLLATGTAFWGQLYILKNLPFVDCLPYAAGKDLLQQMQPPPGSVPDSTTVMFVYKKDGKEVSFDAASFPDDFDEQTYTFVKRNEVLVRKGTGQAAIQDFAFFGADGQDTTK
ncbi:MAG TPA: DoxX family protein, partial [Phnomibacter sp.]|nr:DoxX family protein [Phnomibacter sp.]